MLSLGKPDGARSRGKDRRMNKYKRVFLLLRLLSSLIILGTILFVFFPVYQNMSKPKSDLAVSFLMKNDDPYAWFKKHEKIREPVSDKEQVLFADEQILDQLVLERIYHKSIVLEQVFDGMKEEDAKIQQLSALTGISYSGYSGKTYQDLSSKDEVSQKIREQYKAKTGKAWKFYGEGIILSSLEHIIVLQKGRDYNGTMELSSGSLTLPYRGSFEITAAGIGTDAKADFQLNLTSKGEDTFEKYGLEAIFPAYYVMKSPLYQLYYFAGDFSAYQPDLPAIHELMPTIMKHKILYTKQNNEQAYWQWYYPQLEKILENAKDDSITYASESGSDGEFYVQNKKIFRKNSDTESKEFFIKGVNLGAALPGKAFTEFPQDKEVYLEWFAAMAKMNANTVRVYTLFPPVFYEALYEFNQNRTEPLYLFQEIWPEENPTDSNYLAKDYNITYQKEIKNIVDAIHGNSNIPERQYRSYGLYRFDVSRYLLGYLVGREMEPEEVMKTDGLNQNYMYQGDYIYSEAEASPTESWLAASCDYVLQMEAGYASRPMVGIVSWPTLDSISHDSEWNVAGDKTLQYNDSAVVDINHIAVNTDKVSGFFGAYHIYPNYPDFMNNDTKYAKYQDDQGQFRYGGYLKEFMETNSKYPAIVAEYGISTSMYTAHYNPNGYNHGGLSEEEQADGIIRMTKAIIAEEYAGAIIFEWMDEWAKKTWITEPYMIPYSRNAFWHNAMDPEQNYGLIAFRSNQNIGEELSVLLDNTQIQESVGIKTVRGGQDESYLYLDLEFAADVSKTSNFTLAISTESEKAGADYPEFVIQYKEKPELLVNPGYNWIKGHYMAKEYEIAKYEQLIQQTNNENTDKNGVFTPSLSQNLSNLHVGSFSIPQNQIQIDKNHVMIRLPYGLLGISDPSTLSILSDDKEQIPTAQDSIGIKKNDKIKYTITYGGKNASFVQTLIPWKVPEVNSIQKKSFEKIGAFFGEIK